MAGLNLPFVSNQYPGQPGDLPPTQVAPGNVPQQPGYPQQPPGYPQQPPPAPYGAPGGGYPPPGPPPFGAPPTGGGGGKKLGLILGILGGVLLLVIVAIALLFWPVGLLVDDDDGDDDADRPKVTATVTQTSDLPTSPSTELTSPTEVTTAPTTETTDTTGLPTEDPEITAAAYLNSLVEGNCPAVEGLSTPEWWQATFGTQRACERQSDDSAEMTTAVYNSFEDPVDNGDGTITLVGDVTDSSDGTDYTVTWVLAPSPDNTTWLVSSFQLA